MFPPSLLLQNESRPDNHSPSDRFRECPTQSHCGACKVESGALEGTFLAGAPTSGPWTKQFLWHHPCWCRWSGHEATYAPTCEPCASKMSALVQPPLWFMNAPMVSRTYRFPLFVAPTPWNECSTGSEHTDRGALNKEQGSHMTNSIISEDFGILAVSTSMSPSRRKNAVWFSLLMPGYHVPPTNPVWPWRESWLKVEVMYVLSNATTSLPHIAHDFAFKSISYKKQCNWWKIQTHTVRFVALQKNS